MIIIKMTGKYPFSSVSGNFSTVPATGFDSIVSGNFSTVMVTGFDLILNGPITSTDAVKVPVTFLGPRHVSEHVPPQPYSKVNVRSYPASLFLILSFGAAALLPFREMVIRSPRLPFSSWLKLN